MSNLYFYADEGSISELQNDTQKIISCGSDFGYGNFGDILQNVNSISFLKKNKNFSVISIFTVDAIGFANFPIWAKKTHGMDAVIYVSHHPIDFSSTDVELKPVLEIKNMAAFHLYGGGFLNEMWGDIYIKIAEFFMGINSGMKYFISGQQISSSFVPKLIEHFKRCPPTMVGVRDEDSLEVLRNRGVFAEFSFDDATERLKQFAENISLRKGNGVFVHLNISDYTANEEGFDLLEKQLLQLQTKKESENVTLFQAFRDPREGVFDTRESLKQIDYRFPFDDYRVIELVPKVYANNLHTKNLIEGEIGFSCSYHVALMLQLSGIPCWLRSSNGFYSQKAKALQVNQTFSEFLSSPNLANHNVNLERRLEWLYKFENELLKLPHVKNCIKISNQDQSHGMSKFLFKGYPKANELILNKNNELIKADSSISQLQMQVDAYAKQISLVSSFFKDEFESKFKVFETERERLLLLHQEDRSTIENILQSRSWKITKPLRVAARFIKQGHLDSKGKIGLTSAIKMVAKKAANPFKKSSHNS